MAHCDVLENWQSKQQIQTLKFGIGTEYKKRMLNDDCQNQQDITLSAILKFNWFLEFFF